MSLRLRIAASFAIVFIIATLGIVAHQYTSMDWLIARETQLRNWVNGQWLSAWFIGFLVYFGLSLIPGTPGKSVVFGWLYGFWGALLMVDIALTIAAVVTFLASRMLLREAIESRFGIHLSYVRNRLQSNADLYLLMVRLVHAPFSFVNYTAGATNIVPLRTFWWTTQLGMLPGIAVFVFAGTTIPHLSDFARGGISQLLNTRLMFSLAIASAFPLIIRLLFKSWQQFSIPKA